MGEDKKLAVFDSVGRLRLNLNFSELLATSH